MRISPTTAGKPKSREISPRDAGDAEQHREAEEEEEDVVVHARPYTTSLELRVLAWLRIRERLVATTRRRWSFWPLRSDRDFVAPRPGIADRSPRDR